MSHNVMLLRVVTYHMWLAIACQCGLSSYRHANHSAFGGIIPHFRRVSAIPCAICEIPSIQRNVTFFQLVSAHL